MFEAVQPVPEGDTTAARFAATAADYGYEGIVVRNRGGSPIEYDADRIRETYDVDVITGVEIRAPDPSRASGHLGTLRETTPIVLLGGGTKALNRFAVEQDRVDVLTRPLAGDGEFDHVLAREAADHDVRVEVNFERILRTRGGTRVQAIADLQRLRRLLTHYDVRFVVSAAPNTHLQLRAPRELIAVGEVVGFDRAQIEAGLAEWGRIAARNRRRLSDSFISPGIERGRYDE